VFTGLIEEQGIVTELEHRGDSATFSIRCDKLLQDIYIDASISVNGCCLTVEHFDGISFRVTAIEETLRKTNIGKLKDGDLVNLERALKQGDRLGGHMVQGHIDTTAKLIDILPEKSGVSMVYNLDEKNASLVVPMGSICIDGISLTVAEVSNQSFRVAIIPHTWGETNISKQQKGYYANIEFDMTGKYILKMIDPYIKQIRDISNARIQN